MEEDQIFELYTGEPPDWNAKFPNFPLPARTGEPPGRKEAGCTREFHEAMTTIGPFVWAWGQSEINSRILSIATVAPERWGASLFLAPAAQLVHDLILRFGAVGGIRRFNVSPGDFYPVLTPLGTYILIRREKGTEQAAKPFHLVPPQVAQAWVVAMAKSHTFLWPVRRSEDGTVIYSFDTNTVPTHVAYSFPYHPTDTPEPQLGERELEEDAALAG